MNFSISNRYLTTAFLVLAGCVRLQMIGIRFSVQFAVEIGVCLLFSLLLWERNKCFSAFLMICMISTAFCRFSADAYLTMHMVFYGAIGYYIMTMIDADYLLDAICIIAIINVFWQGLQLFDQDPLFQYVGSKALVGLLSNQNFTSALMACSIPAFFRKKWQPLILLPIIGLVAAQSYGGVISLAAAIMYLSFVYGGWKYIVPVCVLLLSAFLFVDLPGFERGKAWSEMFGVALQNGWTGQSIGSFFRFSDGHYFAGVQTPWHYCHNEYLQVFFELGIVGLAPVTAYCFYLLSNIKKVEKHIACGVLVVLANSFINHMFHIGTTALVGLIWLAAFHGGNNDGWNSNGNK